MDTTLYCIVFLQNNEKKSVRAVHKHYHDRLYKIHNMQRRGNNSNAPTEVRTRRGGEEYLPYTSPDLHKFSSGRITIFNILNILHLLVVESIDTKPSYAKGCMHPKCLDKNQSKKLSNF